jgi:hypothetical protein
MVWWEDTVSCDVLKVTQKIAIFIVRVWRPGAMTNYVKNRAKGGFYEEIIFGLIWP